MHIVSGRVKGRRLLGLRNTPAVFFFFLLITKLNIPLPHDSTIAFLCVYPRDVKTYGPKKTCTRVLIVALFRIAPNWKQPKCSSAGNWINQPWWYLTILPKQKKRSNDPHTTAGSVSNTLCRVKETVSKKNAYYMIPFNEVLKQTKLIYSGTNVVTVVASRHGEGGIDWEGAWPLSAVLVMLYILIGVWEPMCMNKTDAILDKSAMLTGQWPETSLSTTLSPILSFCLTTSLNTPSGHNVLALP